MGVENRKLKEHSKLKLQEEEVWDYHVLFRTERPSMAAKNKLSICKMYCRKY